MRSLMYGFTLQLLSIRDLRNIARKLFEHLNKKWYNEHIFNK